MDWMENKIKEVIESLIELNEENFLISNITDYDRGYMGGLHDGLLDVLNAFDIETNEVYYNE